MQTPSQFRVLWTVLFVVWLAGCIEMPVQLPATGVMAEPTRKEVAEAIREALSQGITRSVQQLGREGGFADDARVHIPLPDELDRVADALERLDQGHYVREFEQSLNRAAEQSVPYASAIFAKALSDMTVEDAIAIVRGPDDTATRYFRERTEPELKRAFYPIVAEQTSRVGVTQAYKDMIDRTGVFKSYLSADVQDLDAYVTQRALDGLFLYVAEEERRIREQPIARTTELLRRVFGYYAN